MAAVTVTTTGSPHDQSATCRRKCFLLTGPAIYATGGDTGLAAALGWGKLFALLGSVLTNGTTSILAWLDPSTGYVMYFDMAGAQIANAANLSAYTGKFEAVGQ